MTYLLVKRSIASSLAGLMLVSACAVPADEEYLETLCELEEISEDQARALRARADYDEIIKYMAENCPAQAAALADMPTGAISTPRNNDGGEGGGSGGGDSGGGDSGGGGSNRL